MTTILRSAVFFGLTALLLGCGNSGGGGFHLPRPVLLARGAALTSSSATVEILSRNATDAPLWIRRLDVTLSAGGTDFAAGTWEGNRLIDPGTSSLLALSLPLLEGTAPPASDTMGSLSVETRYARSGVLGLLGGESFTYTLPVLIRPTD